MIGRTLARRLAGHLVLRELRRRFRRVVWRGPVPELTDGPVVLYANHHYFHDGYLAWLLVSETLRRPGVLWMEGWDRVPLFGPLGVLPFPPEDAARRAATLRETVRRMAREPRTVFVLFPEGGIGPEDAGLAPFRTDLGRLARLLPAATRWWPVAVRVAWWGESRPTALLTGGALHDAPDGREAERLQALLGHLHAARPQVLSQGDHLLLDGGQGEQRWDLSALAPLFRRWT